MSSLLKHLVITVFLLVIATIAPVLAQEKITVYPVNYPVAYFAERIGGAHADVVFPAPPDIDPAFWVPDRKTIGDYQKADLIVLNGAGYAKWTAKVSLPLLRTVDTSKSFEDTLIAMTDEITHSHGPGGDHSHSGTAFTTWLDFSQAARQAEAIHQALSKKLPDYQKELETNFQMLEKDLLDLDRQLTELSALHPRISLFGSHPVYQYLARRYELNITMVMWEPNEDPGEQNWTELKSRQTEHPASWMIWEDEPLQASVNRLADFGIKSLVFSPCFNRPEKADFLSVMKQNIENLRAVFEPPK
jgi:zinc transport system substrate-binding protein